MLEDGGILVASVMSSGQDSEHKGCALCLPAFAPGFSEVSSCRALGISSPRSVYFLDCSVLEQAADLFWSPALSNNYSLSGERVVGLALEGLQNPEP